MKGAAPRSGRAFLTPPPESRRPGALVGDQKPRVARRAEMRLHLVGEVVDVDDDGVDAGFLEAVEDMVEKRAAGDLDQRLGLRQRQRAHARAEAGGEQHGAG